MLKISYKIYKAHKDKDKLTQHPFIWISNWN